MLWRHAAARISPPAITAHSGWRLLPAFSSIRYDVACKCVVQLGADGSGAFQLVSQPGTPLMHPPARLLRPQLEAVTAGAPAEQDTLRQSQQSGGLAQSPGAGRHAAAQQAGSDSGSGPPRRRLVAEFLVTDPAAEGVPPAAFVGMINRAEARRKARRKAATEGSNERQPPAAAPAADAQNGGSGPEARGGSCSAASAANGGTATAQQPCQAGQPNSHFSNPPAAASNAATRQQPSPEAAPPATLPSAAPQLDQQSSDAWAPYRVPDAELAARGIVLDIASPQSAVVNCFAKSYGHYSKVCCMPDRMLSGLSSEAGCCLAALRSSTAAPSPMANAARWAWV